MFRLLADSLCDADEGREGLSTSAVLRTLRHFTGDDGRTQYAFRSVIGRFHSLRFQKSQQMPTIMLGGGEKYAQNALSG